MTAEPQYKLPLSAYEKLVKSEGIPVLGGYHIYDLNQVSLGNWERKGGRGAFINLVGNEGSTDSYLCEIPPGGSLRPQKHLYEEIIYVLSGRGATTVWSEGNPGQTFEWQAGSLFAIPINAHHQHFNGQGDKPARYLGATNAPLVVNLFHNPGFIFNNPYTFTDRYTGEEDYFSRQGKLAASEPVRGLAPAWETNFVADVRAVKLFELGKRGGGNYSICFELADSTMTAHLSEFVVGTYKKAHRHGPGANIIIISGKGYSMMWPEGKEPVKIPWQSGSILVPPDKWFHQHFNTGTEPARYMALRWGSQKYIFPALWKADDGSAVGKDQIEYGDENPAVRKMFEEELSRNGIKSKMDGII
ncbi:MAG: cupin domain-containing protein [Dehalococcoidia bacterium]|nr:cupin domain-containing protein [Dehalococcoidia bacterium]MDZ4247233.1 cupin domain-containing protein [Dehalococcoidia bacterium]